MTSQTWIFIRASWAEHDVTNMNFVTQVNSIQNLHHPTCYTFILLFIVWSQSAQPSFINLDHYSLWCERTNPDSKPTNPGATFMSQKFRVKFHLADFLRTLNETFSLFSPWESILLKLRVIVSSKLERKHALSEKKC